LYNKFPFAPWHLLVVPEPAQTLPQFLSQTHHARMMTLVAEQASVLPGLGMAFNSLGAYASINQLHFQGFVRETRLPVELPRWQHRGGDEAYPLECWHTTSTQDAWQMIESLHQAKQPYNLLYRADGCYILPRKGQGRVELPNWAQGIAWHEACGVFTLAERHMLEGTGAEISQQLGKLHHQG
jgi:diadenosine tetraphosphate (Ap4A) HIT family hydrolase